MHHRPNHNALLRLRAGNATGEVVSSPALLSVAERLIAPVVTLDPVGITVTEGETASFSAAATGKPLPVTSPNVNGFTALSASNTHALVLGPGDVVFAWGSNLRFALADTDDRSTPTMVTTP